LTVQEHFSLLPDVVGQLHIGPKFRKNSEIARNAEAANLVGAQLVRLTTGWDLDSLVETLETRRLAISMAAVRPALSPSKNRTTSWKRTCRRSSCLRKGASHQCHNAEQAGLMDVEAIEKAFDAHDALSCCCGSLRIEEHERFSESSRETAASRLERQTLVPRT
jgi:hypothetical protein